MQLTRGDKPVIAMRVVLGWLQVAGLGLIALATVVAVVQQIVVMADAQAVSLADLLLLFIYLEVLAMVGLYLESGQLPVRLPLYIAIVALARYLALDMKTMAPWEIVAVSGAALLLAVAVLVVRFGHAKYPYDGESAKETDSPRNP
jgi:protein PsiE